MKCLKYHGVTSTNVKQEGKAAHQKRCLIAANGVEKNKSSKKFILKNTEMNKSGKIFILKDAEMNKMNEISAI